MQIVQIGLNTSDMPGTLRLYAALGFDNAGGQGLWGETIRVQGLEPDGRAIVWWMVGPQPLLQLEFFHHTQPPLRPLPDGWTAANVGWTRYGIVIDDLDARLENLAPLGVRPVTAPKGEAGARRVAFRDPFIGTMVELMERGAAPAWVHPATPALVYAAASSSDLDGSRAYFHGIIAPEAELLPLEALHSPADEALWGLGGREREGFALRLGEVALEFVRYAEPGAPRAPDYRCSDQGMVNVALGSRSIPAVADTFRRLEQAGYTPPVQILTEDLCAGYIIDAEREVELIGIVPAMDAQIGFAPSTPFFSAAEPADAAQSLAR